MKRWVKVAAGVAGVVVVVVAAVPLFVHVDTFRPLIEREASANVGRQVTLGHLSLSVLRGNIVADGFNVAEDPRFGTKPFLTGSELRIGAELKPLIFDHRVVVRSLEVEGAQAHVIHAADNSWNFSSLGHQANSQAAPSQGPPLQDVMVSDCQLTLHGLPEGAPLLVYDTTKAKAGGSAIVNEFAFSLSGNLPVDGSLKVEGKAGPLDRTNFVGTPLDAQVALHHFDPVGEGLLEKSAGIAMLADVDAHVISSNGIVSSDGTVHAQHLQLRPDAPAIPKPIDIAFKAKHNLADNTGQLLDSAAQTGKITVHVSGTYAITPAAITVNLRLTGNKVPIDELQTLLPAAGVKLPTGSVLRGGTLTTNLNITGTLQDRVISGPVEADNTSLAGFNVASKLSGVVRAAAGDTGDITHFQTIRMKVKVTKAGVLADDIYMSMPSLGEAVGSGTVSSNDALDFRLTMKVDPSHGVGGAAVGVLTKMSGTAGKSASESAKTGLPVTVTGTASNPIITPDVGKMVKSNATAILGKGPSAFAGLFGKGKK